MSTPADAQQWPARQVRLIVPYPAGGNVDSAARVIADRLQAKLGQPFIVENKAGAGGLIAGEAFAKMPPDGYALFVGANGPVLFAPEIAKRDAYNWKRDFVPITSITMTPLVLEVHPSVAAKDLKEFIELARRDPGKLTMASPGQGTTNHLLSELMQSTLGLRMADGALPRQRPCPQRPDRRTGAIRAGPDLGRTAFHQERHAARACRHRQPPRLLAS